MVWGGYALIFLHLAGVAKHQFVGRSPVLHRMLPFLKPRSAT
jgi:cytochrome b561